VLPAEISRRAGRGHADHLLLALGQQLETVLADRLEMSAARDERDVDTRLLHQHTDVGADCAGAEDADLHDGLPRSLCLSLFMRAMPSRAWAWKVKPCRGAAWVRRDTPCGRHQLPRQTRRPFPP